MGYFLTGDFVECCDCFTICPCWVSDVPDEDHCSGLYVWSFGGKSKINSTSVAGMHVAAATYHAVRAGGQVLFFIDAGPAGPGTEKLLFDAFSGTLGGADLVALAKLLGVSLGYKSAAIRAAFAGNAFAATVTVNGATIATAAGGAKMFPGQGGPMTLRDTALSGKLGVGAGDVTVQAMGGLMVDVAALPGGPLNFRGRSGMRSKFTYSHTPARSDGRKREPQDSEAEG